jgi:flagellar basal-body rod protein FlgB
MPISGLPIFSMLRTRMDWHQERQRLLAENVANADTPQFRPRDLLEPDLRRTTPSASNVTLARTASGHLGPLGGAGTQFDTERKSYQIRPTGNAVHLEEQMMKIAANQMDYQAATTLYSRSLGLIKTALGKR